MKKRSFVAPPPLLSCHLFPVAMYPIVRPRGTAQQRHHLLRQPFINLVADAKVRLAVCRPSRYAAAGVDEWRLFRERRRAQDVADMREGSERKQIGIRAHG